MPLYTWWIKTLSAICNETYISCQSSQIADINYPFIIEDQSTDSGPLEGIHNAFLFNSAVSWLVVACDLVYAGEKDIDFLVNHNQFDKSAVCFENSETGEPFPLLSIYNSKIIPSLEKEYHSALKSAKNLLKKSDAIIIKPPSSKILKGINTIEDLENWQGN